MQLGQLDKEYEKFRDNEEDLERWVGDPLVPLFLCCTETNRL